jgi:hypothetical protein
MSDRIRATTKWFDRFGRGAAAIGTCMFLCSAPAIAGMPDFTPGETTRRLVLTDAGRLRYEAISFFLFILLLSAVAVRFLWNRAAKDFAFLPRLSFARALGIVVTWGLLVLVVLTMIAAAREMMTPGSWRKQGLLYSLDDKAAKAANAANVAADQPAHDAATELRELRRKNLDDLKAALWKYAAGHNGKLPAKDDTDIPANLWEVPKSYGARYGYVAGLTTSQDSRIVVFEPAVHGDQRFVLRLDGRIELLSTEAIGQELQQVAP